MTSLIQANRYNETGNQAYRTKSFREAIDYYTKAIGCYSGEVRYYCNRAKCHLLLNNYEAALEDSRVAIAINASFPRAILREAECHVFIGEYEKASSALRRLERTNPTFAGCKELASKIEELQRLEEKARNTDDVDLALQLTSEILESAPACRRISILRIERLLERRPLEEVRNLFKQMVRVQDLDLDVIYVRALFSYQEVRLEEAATLCREVLDRDPDYVKAVRLHRTIRRIEQLLESGRKETRAQNYEAARDIYGCGVTIDQENRAIQTRFLLNRAIVQLKLENPREAKEDCDRAIALDDKQGKAFYQRAHCHVALGNRDAALQDLEQAYKLNPHAGIRNKIREVEKLEFDPHFDFQAFANKQKTTGSKSKRKEETHQESKKDRGISLEELHKVLEQLKKGEAKEVFGIADGSSPKDVQRILNRMIKKYHPDNYNDNPNKKAICQDISRMIQEMRASNGK